MKVLTDVQCQTWFATHGVKFLSDEHLSLPSEGLVRHFPIPTQSRTQLVLSHKLAQWLDFPESLLWMSVWTAYEPDEMELFLRFRRQYDSERHSLINARGHLFDQKNDQEVDTMAEVVLFMMAFNWEGYLISSDLQCVIWMADEIIQTVVQDREKDLEMLKLFTGLAIEQIADM